MADQEMNPLSDAAIKRQKVLEDKESRGETIGLADLFGILEPNPDLPNCPSEESGREDGPWCQLPNHHEGEHQAMVKW